MSRSAIFVVALLFSCVGWAQDLSGSWNTTVAIGKDVVPLTHLTFNFEFADWELATSFTLEGMSLVDQEISLEASLGTLCISAGAAFRFPGDVELEHLGPGGFSLGDPEFLGGFITFELSLGNLTLKVTLVQGVPPRGP